MTKRQVFYSFHYEPDSWRAAQIRNIGVIEGNNPVSSNEWEKITKGGDKAIKQWIDDQMKYKSCTVVLVGSNTANRRWINHEIRKSWDDGKGVVGIHIHGLKDKEGNISEKGDNPFSCIGYDKIAKCYDPQGSNSKDRYDWISEHLSYVVEEAIRIRKQSTTRPKATYGL